LSEVTVAREEKNQWRFHRIPRHSTCAPVRTNELEVSAAMGAHLHCSPFLQPNRPMWDSHRVMADLLIVCTRRHSE
jgi:hypothetical protein